MARKSGESIYFLDWDRSEQVIFWFFLLTIYFARMACLIEGPACFLQGLDTAVVCEAEGSFVSFKSR